ncbi:MAG: gamma-glutamyltransferase [Rhodospirillales bacterium]|nr:gamma-glutamyltransferase [Rhodospirillales bacterium]MCB9965277.1 gamma-glutamyltransferase [Rhodospirillales bacterium]MCB9972953.1 gamma-glutamyltransferase [Rhodospirillales bacterium]
MTLRSYITLFIIIFQALPAYAQSHQIALPAPKPTVSELLSDGKDDNGMSPELFELTPEHPLSSAQTPAEFMIVTANPIASEVGYDILEKGGTAADAAFAAQLVLGLVEPQSSGLGGGGFLLYWDARKKELISLDGRETAPESVTETYFLKPNGKILSFEEASIGGKSVGVPGMPGLLDELYKRYGKMSREDIFQPALELSKYGFITSPLLVEKIEKNKEQLKFFKTTKEYFLTDADQPISAYQNVRNPDYNDTLFDFKTMGADVFYTGRIGHDILEAVNTAWHNPGRMTQSDLTQYQVKTRDPVCGNYRIYKVCSMGEPSSGGLTLINALQILDRFDLETHPANDPTGWHLILEASRLAFADRDQFMSDPDAVQTPGTALISPAYTAVRSTLIDPEKAQKVITSGKPKNWDQPTQAADHHQKNTGTTHISAVDKYGNIISLTASIEAPFGSKMMVDGFLLNNQLTDFSFVPEKDGGKVANRPGPGKRPRSSMTPTIVFNDKNEPILVIGSPGGSRIIGYVLQRVIALLDWKIPLEDALKSANILTRGDGVEIEKIEADKQTLENLRNLQTTLTKAGHTVTRSSDMDSGLSVILRQDKGWIGAADPRREGTVGGVR